MKKLALSPDLLSRYPYRDTEPSARCFLWKHEAAVVQWDPSDQREHFTCACGKRTWRTGERRLWGKL